MVTGNGANANANAGATTSNYNPNALMVENRTMQNDKSPLQVFVRAKKKINDIYGEIEEYVVETTQFINGKCSAIAIGVRIIIKYKILSSACRSRNCGQGGT